MCVCVWYTLAATQGSAHLYLCFNAGYSESATSGPHNMRQVWDIKTEPYKMQVCPDNTSRKLAWREMMVLSWQHKSILYAVGFTHTIDGQGGRKLPKAKVTRI